MNTCVYIMHLNATNDYKAGDKSFYGVTNASPVNCIVCWFLWLFCLFLGLWFTILIIAFLILALQGELMDLQVWLFAAIKSYLLNKPWPLLITQKDREVENFIDTEK